MKDQNFYSKLQAYELSLSELLSSQSNFSEVPESWHIVVVDIEKSTQAVDHKLHHPVNYAASLSIAAVQNELYNINEEIEFPFFFGGDGTTFLLPEKHLQRLLLILENLRDKVYESNFLTLRVGSVNFSKLVKEKACSLKIAKLKITDNLIIPIVFGDALIKAEELIKSELLDAEASPRQKMYLDSTGCECRWEKIALHNKSNKVFCFIAQITNDAKQLETLHKISSKLDEIFGQYIDRLPVDVESLKTSEQIYKIHQELNELFDSSSFVDDIILSINGVSQKLYNSSDIGEKFYNQFKHSSLAMLIDGSYNDIIQGDQEKIDEFIAFLEELESDGDIVFGHHTTDHILLSCYVANPDNGFVQLLDGCEGGYSTAAKMLKTKAKIIK